MSHLKLIKIGAGGPPLAAASTEEHVAVQLYDHGLMFTATNVAENVPHAECEAACKACTVGGFTDWRMPTSHELMLLIDHSRRSPAIDSNLFPRVLPRWHWTSTPLVKTDSTASSSDAWLVSFYDGSVDGLNRSLNGFALAVRRAGQ